MDVPRHELHYAAPPRRRPAGEREIVPATLGAIFGYVAALIAHVVLGDHFCFELAFLVFSYTESARLFLGDSMRIYSNSLSLLAASHFIVYGAAMLVADFRGFALWMLGWIVVVHAVAVIVYAVLWTLMS
jgi:hypothetical protein